MSLNIKALLSPLQQPSDIKLDNVIDPVKSMGEENGQKDLMKKGHDEVSDWRKMVDQKKLKKKLYKTKDEVKKILRVL